jgi:hypothetical protein
MGSRQNETDPVEPNCSTFVIAHPNWSLEFEPFAKQIPMAKSTHDCGRVCRAWEQSHRIRTARPCLAQRLQQAIEALRRYGQIWRDSDAD